MQQHKETKKVKNQNKTPKYLTEYIQVPKQMKGIDTSTAYYLNRTLFQWCVQP